MTRTQNLTQRFSRKLRPNHWKAVDAAVANAAAQKAINADLVNSIMSDDLQLVDAALSAGAEIDKKVYNFPLVQWAMLNPQSWQIADLLMKYSKEFKAPSAELLSQGILSQNHYLVSHCLEKGVSPNSFYKIDDADGPNEVPMICLAAMVGDITILRGLYAAGAKIDVADSCGKMPADWSREWENEQIWNDFIVVEQLNLSVGDPLSNGLIYQGSYEDEKGKMIYFATSPEVYSHEKNYRAGVQIAKDLGMNLPNLAEGKILVNEWQNKKLKLNFSKLFMQEYYFDNCDDDYGDDSTWPEPAETKFIWLEGVGVICFDNGNSWSQGPEGDLFDILPIRRSRMVKDLAMPLEQMKPENSNFVIRQIMGMGLQPA